MQKMARANILYPSAPQMEARESSSSVPKPGCLRARRQQQWDLAEADESQDEGAMRNVLLAIVTLSFLLSGQLSQAKPRIPIKIVDGKVEITQYNKQIFRLEGEWRFSDKNLKTIDEKQFSTLPLKSAYLKSPYWEFYSPGPARGAFVLRIDTDAAYSLMALTYAITARSQLLLVNEEGIRESYVDPFFGQASLEQTRREMSLPTFHLELAKGTNFLIYNYYPHGWC
jgi:hypothetical protein